MILLHDYPKNECIIKGTSVEIVPIIITIITITVANIISITNYYELKVQIYYYYY